MVQMYQHLHFYKLEVHAIINSDLSLLLYSSGRQQIFASKASSKLHRSGVTLISLQLTSDVREISFNSIYND